MQRKHWTLVLILLAFASVIIAGCSAAPAATTAVQQVTPQAVAERLPADLDDGLIVLDVRTPQEWEDDGHIAGATLIPLQELEARAQSELPQDAEIIVYCRSGNRSAQAADYLVSAGYTDVSDLGGIQEWKAAGYEVVYGP